MRKHKKKRKKQRKVKKGTTKAMLVVKGEEEKMSSAMKWDEKGMMPGGERTCTSPLNQKSTPIKGYSTQKKKH